MCVKANLRSLMFLIKERYILNAITMRLLIRTRYLYICEGRFLFMFSVNSEKYDLSYIYLRVKKYIPSYIIYMYRVFFLLYFISL